MEKKDIEIPFGAYDSELDGFEYTIPEGYEAEIRDGKIVVRKIESEDEKIRKAIIEIVKKDEERIGTNAHLKKIQWLEKHGEKGAKGNEKEIPNSAWSEEDEAVLDALIRGFEGEHIYVSPFLAIRCLKSLKDRVQPQPKQEWSEEGWTMQDEEELDIAIKTLEEAGQYSSANWLKNVCLVPRPKQEWSGEDERIIDNLVSQLGNLYARKLIKEETKDKYVNWLKSLKDKSTWKPSDEQMDAVRYVFKHYLPAPTDTLAWDALQTIELMLEQLKKQL